MGFSVGDKEETEAQTFSDGLRPVTDCKKIGHSPQYDHIQ